MTAQGSYTKVKQQSDPVIGCMDGLVRGVSELVLDATCQQTGNPAWQSNMDSNCTSISLGCKAHSLNGCPESVQEQLRAPVDQFMSKLAPHRGFWRVNWSVADDPNLFQASYVRLTWPRQATSNVSRMPQLIFGHTEIEFRAPTVPSGGSVSERRRQPSIERASIQACLHDTTESQAAALVDH